MNAPVTTISQEEERELVRSKFTAVLEKTDFPQILARETLGCSRTTLHNWIKGEEISNAYLEPVMAMTEVLEMCVALKTLPLADCKRRTVHATFYGAIATLKNHLQG